MSEYKLRISVKALFFNDKEEVVLIKSPNGDYWSTPGGGLEENESLTEAVERELKEETGLIGKADKVVFIQEYINNKGNKQLEIFFSGKVTGNSEYKPDQDFAFVDKEAFKTIEYRPCALNPFELNNSVDFKPIFQRRASDKHN